MALIGGLTQARPPQASFPSVFGPFGGARPLIPGEPFTGRPTPGGGGGGAPPHTETRLGVLGRQFIQRHPQFLDQNPPWWEAFHRAFFQSKAGDPRQRAISQFLGQHDPFVERYQHFLDLLQAAGVTPGAGGGGGGHGTPQSYYLRPFYGYQQVQNPVAPPPPPPIPVY